MPRCGSLAGRVARSEGALRVLVSDAEGVVEVEIWLGRVREIAVDGKGPVAAVEHWEHEEVEGNVGVGWTWWLD